jgi:ABC-type transporter Mla maintaining outer membrane lipid asymmetry ATPase subunit MlaF
VTGRILEFSEVVKAYGGLRPIRIERLSISAGEQLAIVGLDRPAAEMFVSLATGATLPDRGEIAAFGRSSRALRDGAEWLSSVDRFGIVGERIVLLEGLSVVQNLALPFSLEIEPPPESIRARAIAAGCEVGVPESEWNRPVAEIDATTRVRVWLARALAFDPAIVIFEHPTADTARPDVSLLGHDLRGVLERRGAAGLTLTADREFAAAVASRVLTLDPTTGQLHR